ncbi:Hint domain-containing protein [Roseovarius aestuariivivens]|uniref:Hint domain-containing protein n=1 Tax=Roseovarius aestuariivivens TaxID=1888910 RepID=UPI0010806290|nr:Hint domain-containing protein [Roseovarius aestuariivivens]
MAWLGTKQKTTGWTDLPAASGHRSDPARILRRGTIVAETRLSANRRPQILVDFIRRAPVSGRFSLQAVPGGGIVLVDALGDDMRHATLPHAAESRLDLVRLSYAWDADSGWARLTLEDPTSPVTETIPVADPLPIALDDVVQGLRHGLGCDPLGDRDFIALSDEIEPVGPMPTLTAQVPVLTTKGEIPASEVRRGDIVITDEDQHVPVLQVVSRAVPALGSFQPIRLRAPYFSLKRDIVVAPAQRLVMRGSQVEYMFGREAVLVPARHLINDRSAFFAKGPDLVTYYHLLLPGHESLLASGSPIESLYLGRLRRNADALCHSVLAGLDRTRLPEHARPIWPVLKPFEAVTLATSRAA